MLLPDVSAVAVDRQRLQAEINEEKEEKVEKGEEEMEVEGNEEDVEDMDNDEEDTAKGDNL